MSINWDDLTDEINDSPRARLVQALDEADDMVAVLIAWESKTGEHLSTVFGYSTGLKNGAAAASFLGLAEWVKAQLLAGMTDD